MYKVKEISLSAALLSRELWMSLLQPQYTIVTEKLVIHFSNMTQVNKTSEQKRYEFIGCVSVCVCGSVFACGHMSMCNTPNKRLLSSYIIFSVAPYCDKDKWSAINWMFSTKKFISLPRYFFFIHIHILYCVMLDISLCFIISD